MSVDPIFPRALLQQKPTVSLSLLARVVFLDSWQSIFNYHSDEINVTEQSSKVDDVGLFDSQLSSNHFPFIIVVLCVWQSVSRDLVCPSSVVKNFPQPPARGA